MTTAATPPLRGVDFTSRPTPRKPVTLAEGRLVGDVLRLERLRALPDEAAFAASLREPGPWLGGFDLPFGLPRELVTALGWPAAWHDLIAHYRTLDRAEIRATFAAFCNARPAGAKFAHRACDRPAGSSPSMKWVNPPVAFMLHAGVPCLLAAGAHLPGLHAGNPQRVALEAYPGLLAREVLGARSYKSDDKAKHTPERLLARRELLSALERGQTRLGMRLVASNALLGRLADDASGDALDATLCLMQAAWAQQQHEAGHPQYGLPPCDPLEGWIVTA